MNLTIQRKLILKEDIGFQLWVLEPTEYTKQKTLFMPG